MKFDKKINRLLEALEFDRSREEVREDGKTIADMDFDVEENQTKEDVISYFIDMDKDDPVIRYLKGLKLPKIFTYIWIQLLRIKPNQRGEGRGSEIINTLAMSHPPGSLMALAVGEISSGKTGSSLNKVKEFYQQNGFNLVRSKDGEYYGFRVL
jgi:hypothetical protein